MRIYLVRHGESEANVDRGANLRKPDHAIDLTADGRAQAERAGTILVQRIGRFNAPRLWVSPYARTRQTADGLIKGGLKVIDRKEHIGLVEQQFGLFDGIDDDELPQRFPVEHAHYKKAEDFEGRFWARMPLGESRFDVALRVHQAFGTFKRDLDKDRVENIVVVTHGVVIRAFVMMWCHKTWEWFEQEPNPKNCSVRLIEDSDDRGYVYSGVPPELESRTETI